MYKLIVLDEVSWWDKEQESFVRERTPIFEMETEDERQYHKLLKLAKSSWRTEFGHSTVSHADSLEYEQHTVCLLVTEPDESGVFVEKKLQYTRLPYPNHRSHLWLEVSDWRDDAEGYKDFWTGAQEEWNEAVKRGEITVPEDEQRAWQKKQAAKARKGARHAAA